MVEKINLNPMSSVQKLNTSENKNNKANEKNTQEPIQTRSTFSKDASKGSRALASATIKKPNVQGGVVFENGKDNVSFEILEEKYPLSCKRKLALKSISPNFDDLNRSLLERKIIINQDGEIEKATKEILGAGLFENGRKDDKLSKEEASKMAHQMAKCFNIAEEFGLSKKDFSSQDGLFNLSYNQTKDYFNQIIAYISRMD